MIMTIEEKAKAYDEALERAREYHNVDIDNTMDVKARGILEYLFPELKESEDEKVRKALIEMVHDFTGDSLWVDYNIHKEEALAWLEKQGEQKPFDYEKANIQQKDWAEIPFGAKDSELQEVSYYIPEGLHAEIYDNRVVIKKGEQNPADTVEQKCEESKTKVFDAPTPFEDKLYAFVAACEFLAIPSKIEFILEHSQEILDAAREQIGKEQRSAWTKEDEERLQSCLSILRTKGIMGVYETINTKWLKSLKERYTWKPSNEQMADLWNMLCECRPADHQLLQDIYYGLKKLREGKL